jgi:ornithine--oxo-acid transaminase
MTTVRATSVSSAVSTSAYEEYVNPQWVSLLNLLDMNVEYEKCAGAELFTRDAQRCGKARS